MYFVAPRDTAQKDCFMKLAWRLHRMHAVVAESDVAARNATQKIQ